MTVEIILAEVRVDKIVLWAPIMDREAISTLRANKDEEGGLG